MQTVGYFIHSEKNSKNVKKKYQNLLNEYCSIHGHTVVNTFVDNNMTRLSIYSEFEKLRDDIKSNQNRYLVIINNSSDLGRSIEEITDNLIWFEDNKCKVLCIDDENPDPYQDTVNRYIYSNNDQWSSFVSNKMKQKFANGKWMGRLPYGYILDENGCLIVCPNESLVVKEIFDLYVNQNLGIRKITAILNQKKYKTKKNNSWNISTVYDLIKNPVYIGTSKRFGVSIPNSHSFIIENTVYTAAQQKLFMRSPVRTNINPENYLLSGILHCGFCDSRMIGVTKNIKYINNNNLSKSRYRYYRCSKKQNSGNCNSNSVEAETFEKKFILKFDKEMSSPKVNIGKKFPKILKKIELKRKQSLTNAQRLFKDALINTSKGKIGVDVLKLYLKQYQEIKNSTEYKINIKNVLGKNHLKLNFINKVRVHGSDFKIYYERAS